MIFFSQNDLINHWEGGKTYKTQEDEGESSSVVTDQARTLPYVTKKYFDIKRLYDKPKATHLSIKRELGAVREDPMYGECVVADARYKVFAKGGRMEERTGVFLHAFIDDCIKLWETMKEAGTYKAMTA